MDIFQTLILSIIEGVTEFLPISSTGHLILASNLLTITQTNFVKSFEIAIQLGAILAVVALYYKTISQSKEVWKKILIAFLPAGFLGFLFYKLIKEFLIGNSIVTLQALFIGGVVLILLELFHKEKEYHAEKIEDISDTNAFLIGVFQSIAIIPGVSRSGASILGALLLGVKRKVAVEFSFLLAIPTMLAATALDIVKSSSSFSSQQLFLLTIGFISSFIVALFTVKWFVSYIQKHSFIAFGIYRILLALLFWLLVIH